MPPRTVGALHRLRRIAAAAVALLAVGTATSWYLCIPPFECPLLRAVEIRAEEAERAGGPLGPAERRALSRFDAEVRGGALERVTTPQGAALLVTLPAEADRPSFRRRHTVDGRTWWIAAERDRRLVAWQDGARRIRVVLHEDAATALRIAAALRDD